jgi:phosphohistidine phosphatase SixA
MRKDLLGWGGLFLAAWLSVFTAAARPAEIILLRHAEKPDDDFNTHLSERGKQRALALADFLTKNPALTNHGAPVMLFATRITSVTHSRRPLETLEPLAQRLNLGIQTIFPAAEYKSLARQVLTNPALDGKTIVICWVHDYLPELALALGVKANALRWKANVFDRLWLITWNGEKVKWKDLPQHLLAGDAKR